MTVESTRTQADAAAGGGAAGYVSQTDRIAAAAAEENDAFMGSEVRSRRRARAHTHTSTRTQGRPSTHAHAHAQARVAVGLSHALSRALRTHSPARLTARDAHARALSRTLARAQTDHQQLLMRQQDTDLEALSVSVQRLGGVGKTIAEELETQATMLDELDEEADTVLGRLNATQRRLQRLVKKAGMRGQICMVVFLLITLCVLVAFTFYG